MHPDESRNPKQMEKLRRTYILKDPEALYARYRGLEVRIADELAGGGAGDADQKRRIAELFHALQAERETSAQLSAELSEARKKLVDLRNSRTMKAGRAVKSPLVVARTSVSKFRRLLSRSGQSSSF